MTDDCLGCARLEDAAAETVVLLSGQSVCSWCPAWRCEAAEREIEARALLRLPDRSARLDRLARLESQRGAEYRARLEAVVLAMWERRRAAANPETANV